MHSWLLEVFDIQTAPPVFYWATLQLWRSRAQVLLAQGNALRSRSVPCVKADAATATEAVPSCTHSSAHPLPVCSPLVHVMACQLLWRVTSARCCIQLSATASTKFSVGSRRSSHVIRKCHAKIAVECEDYHSSKPMPKPQTLISVAVRKRARLLMELFFHAFVTQCGVNRKLTLLCYVHNPLQRMGKRASVRISCRTW